MNLKKTAPLSILKAASLLAVHVAVMEKINPNAKATKNTTQGTPKNTKLFKTMEWIYLIVAGVFEVGWPLGFKLSQMPANNKWLWIAFSVISMALSGLFLWMAQRHIPIGTAYAVWTGIGAAGTFIIGIVFFKDPATLLRMLSVLLIMIGIVGLKLAN